MKQADNIAGTNTPGNGFALFATLVKNINQTTKTNDKLQSLVDYFMLAAAKDKVWVIALFTGRRPRRVASSSLLRNWCSEIVQVPDWLLEECYHTTGDLAETISLLLPGNKNTEVEKNNLSYYAEKFISLEKESEVIKKNFITGCWEKMNRDETFVFNKLITGSFRIGVSQKMIVNALAKTIQVPASSIAHRITGNWDPVTTKFEDLLGEAANSTDFSKPYPFYLAYALDTEPKDLGSINEWQAEWKWDGIRGQLIKRNDELFVWSRGEELMTDKFPEYQILKDLLPNGIALDGEIIPAIDGKPLPFAVLQTRIGRKNISKKQLSDAPIHFFVYDLLEYEGNDCRKKPLYERRALLENLVNEVNNSILQISPVINFETWEFLASLRESSRDMNSEGIMLKRKNSIYQAGRKRGDWLKWKIEPLTIDCVLVYAQKGSGRRGNLYTDYTFAVKDGDKLVTFTKAYSGLTDKEFAQVDHFVKRNSLEKFGPVRTVKPELVFEIAFEGIAESKRHKSGVALRFPRMSRWRKDKNAEDINTMEDLREMLEMYGK